MEIVILIALIVGLLMFVLSSNSKLSDIGRILFACALLALLFGASPHVPRLR